MLLARQMWVDGEMSNRRENIFLEVSVGVQYLMAHGHMKYQFISLIKLYMYLHNTYCYIFRYLCKILHEPHSKYLILFKNIHSETFIGYES